MQVPIYCGTEQVGVLEAQRRGLYTCFSGEINDSRLCKIHGVFEEGDCGLGIPVPERGRMVLRASMPTTRLPKGRLLEGRLVCSEEQTEQETQEKWMLFDGGCVGDAVLPKGERCGNDYRFPWRPGETLPAEELLCFYELKREQDCDWLILRLDDCGNPVV